MGCYDAGDKANDEFWGRALVILEASRSMMNFVHKEKDNLCRAVQVIWCSVENWL